MMGENCAEEKKKRELLKKWIQESREPWYFSEERESPQRAEFPISEAWTVFTIRSMIIRRRQFEPYLLFKEDRGILPFLQK